MKISQLEEIDRTVIILHTILKRTPDFSKHSFIQARESKILSEILTQKSKRN